MKEKYSAYLTFTRDGKIPTREIEKDIMNRIMNTGRFNDLQVNAIEIKDHDHDDGESQTMILAIRGLIAIALITAGILIWIYI